MPSAVRAEAAPDRGLELVRGPHPTADDARPREVFAGLRAVRTIAMLSIVGYHVTWQPVFGIAFGLTSLQIILSALAGRGAAPRPAAGFARRRAARLLGPWLAWSAIYTLFEVARHTLAGDGALSWLEPWMWASGASFHLWFLPFGFAASMVANAGMRAFREPWPGTYAIAAALVGVGLLLVADPLKLFLRPAEPLDLWIDGAPTVAFGLAVGRTLTMPDRAQRAGVLLGVALLGLLPFLLGGTLVPHSGLFERYAVAIPVVCLGLIVPLPDRPWMAAIAATNLGVYLAHMLVIRALDHVPGILELGGPARVGVTYAACLLLVLIVRRLRVPWVA